MTGPWQAACRKKQFEHPQLLQFTPSLLLQAPDPRSETGTESWGQWKLQSLPGPVCQGPWVSTQCSYSHLVEIKVACAAEVLGSLLFCPRITGKCRWGETPGGQLNQASQGQPDTFLDELMMTHYSKPEARTETPQLPHRFLWRSHILPYKLPKAAELPLLRASGGSQGFLPQATCPHEVVKGTPNVEEPYWFWGDICDWLTWKYYIKSLLFTALRRNSSDSSLTRAKRVVCPQPAKWFLKQSPLHNCALLQAQIVPTLSRVSTLWRVCVICRGK